MGRIVKTYGSTERRRHRPKVNARGGIVVDGSVVKPGESVPRSVPLRDVERLRVHGYVDSRPGDDHISDGRGG